MKVICNGITRGLCSQNIDICLCSIPHDKAGDDDHNCSTWSKCWDDIDHDPINVRCERVK